MHYAVSYFEADHVRKFYFQAASYDLALAHAHRFCKVYLLHFVDLSLDRNLYT